MVPAAAVLELNCWRMRELRLLVQASNPAASKTPDVFLHVHSQLHNVTSFYWCCCVDWHSGLGLRSCSSRADERNCLWAGSQAGRKVSSGSFACSHSLARTVCSRICRVQCCVLILPLRVVVCWSL